MEDIKENFNVIGHISWLWGCSPLHRSWPMAVFAINTLPAVIHGKYLLLMENGYPVAYCSWANLSLENEIKYIKDTNSLIAEDWVSGDRAWFIDWIAPFGHTRVLYKQMREKFPDHLFRSIRITNSSTTGKISEFYGRDVDRVVAKKQFIKYQYELIKSLRK